MEGRGGLSGAELSLVLERLVRLTRELSSGELSPTAVAVLGRLDSSGAMRLTELARSTGVTQPSMSQLVDRMQRDGLVTRAVTEGDRRGVLVQLSERGAEVLAQRRAGRAAALDRILDRLDPDDLSAIAAALPALGRLVDGVTAGPDPVTTSSATKEADRT